MIPKLAIEKAISGGWKYSCTPKPFSPHGDGMECYYSGANDEWTVWTRKDNDSSICVPHSETAFNSDFWQALGKSLGWHDDIYAALNAYAREDKDTRKQKHWLLTPHDFYEIILLGKPTDDFWKELLK